MAANRKELTELDRATSARRSPRRRQSSSAPSSSSFRLGDRDDRRRSNPIGGSILSYTLKEPVGVAGQIVPWNYPLLMTTWKLAPGAGKLLLRGRPQARPADAGDGAQACGARGRGRLSAGTIKHRPGRRPHPGAYLVRHPGVDKIAFTGSTKTGGEIMRLCSEPIKRLTLELGGKSPNIVFADADLESAIPSAVWSIYYSAGRAARRARACWSKKTLYRRVRNALDEKPSG